MVLVIYWIKKGRKGRQNNVETVELEAESSQNAFFDQTIYELPAEEEPKEIMNDRTDRTELPASGIRPAYELETR